MNNEYCSLHPRGPTGDESLSSPAPGLSLLSVCPSYQSTMKMPNSFDLLICDPYPKPSSSEEKDCLSAFLHFITIS